MRESCTLRATDALTAAGATVTAGAARGLPAFDFAARLDALGAALDGRCAVFNPSPSLAWAIGFTGSSGWLVIDEHGGTLLTDGRYGERAASELAERRIADRVTVEVRANGPELLQAVAAVAGERRLFAEADRLTHAGWTAFAARVDIDPLGDVVAQLRRRKDAGEVARMRAAAAAADAALAEVAPLLAEEPTEADVRAELEYRMRRNGADGPGYDTIVASGPQNAARPHHSSGARRIVEGDMVIIDVGGRVDEYRSDMTRTFVVGEPTAEQQEWYDLVAASQAAGLAAITPGATCRDVHAACVDVFAAAGVDEWYIHGSGHGVGLEIHEEPFHNHTSTATISVGDVVTMEPGLYRPGFGGIRIEDLVAVGSDGNDVLTTFPKAALAVG